MNKEIYFQAGDTLLFEVGEIPKSAVLQKGESILHYGNTGNHHKLTGGNFEIHKDGEKKFVVIGEPTDYVHEEHKAIKLPVGFYELRFVQEKDHFSDIVRPVVD